MHSLLVDDVQSQQYLFLPQQADVKRAMGNRALTGDRHFGKILVSHRSGAQAGSSFIKFYKKKKMAKAHTKYVKHP
ncbi:hypothetical protein DP116_09845 [Brasilonema bromeliae SPC951]|uniref:Uncharacterized protein n=1 Tax=Brasilonema bromeliae SPC951 TaxID=385972 RepID=A0ABX1P633_9CYAN|nr:hypothetical protein [Brasilonema bromeliae SPC951]